MRIESITAHAFGPLAGETLQLAPGLTVVSGVNESAKSSWHAALYAALCGRGRGDAAPTPEDRRLLERYKPWDGAPWLVSAVVVLDDGRRLEICQDLDGGSGGTVVELGDPQLGDPQLGDLRLATRTDVTSEILTAGAPDASRWLGLDRSAFGAVALVNQAEHRAVRDAAHGLQHYLLRAAESARSGGTAGPALAALDRFQQERLGREAGNPLLLAQERVRLAREGRVVARRGQEQYLAGLAAALRSRSSAAEGTARLQAAEQTVRGLESLRDAARKADEARAAAERSRAELSAATAACEAAAARSVRFAASQTQVPEQNSGPAEIDPTADESALLDEVDSARQAWDSRPTPPPLDGPCTRQLRRELAALPDGVDPAVRALAQQHREALDATVTRPGPRPSPRPSPAPPDELRRIADVLVAPAPARLATPAGDEPELAELTSMVEAATTRQRETAARAEAAEQEAAAAGERYERMRAAAPIAGGRRPGKTAGRLKALALTILGVGVGLAALYFGLLAALVFSAIVILPVVVSLLAAVVVAVRAMRRATGRQTGKPLVEDLVGAIVVVREKKAAAARAREAGRRGRAAPRRVPGRGRTPCCAASGPTRLGSRRSTVCTRHGLRADPAALRALADRTHQQSAWHDAERSRLAAAVARTGDELRAALRERGILDEGSPLEQFARYETQAGGTSARRAELERALAARVAAEETAAEVVVARREAVARLRSAAGAAGFDPTGEPEALVAALDGWRAARPARGAVALAERPRPWPTCPPTSPSARAASRATQRRDRPTAIPDRRASRPRCSTAARPPTCAVRRRRCGPSATSV